MLTTAWCESDHCRPHQDGKAASRSAALEGLRLCGGCVRQLAGRIEQLPRLYEECGQALTGGVGGGLRERTSGGPLPGMPLNEAAIETRAAMMTTLGAWSGLVADERGLPAPGRALPQLACFLLRNLVWLAAHPAIAAMEREVAQLVRSAHRTVRPDPVRRIQVGPCTMSGCEGRLVATVRSQQAQRWAHVHCDAEPDHSWALDEWTRLRHTMHRISRATDRWLTAQDISRLWNTSIGTVYRLASEQGWNRHNRSGRTYYAEAEVHECFARRTEASRTRRHA